MPRPPCPPPPALPRSEVIEILTLGLGGHLSPARDLALLLDRWEAAR